MFRQVIVSAGAIVALSAPSIVFAQAAVERTEEPLQYSDTLGSDPQEHEGSAQMPADVDRILVPDSRGTYSHPVVSDPGDSSDTSTRGRGGGTAQRPSVPTEPERDPRETGVVDIWNDPDVVAAHREWLIRWYTRQSEILEHRQSAFAWNDRISRIIFWAVQVVLLVGVFVAVWEFIAASGQRKAASQAETEIRVSLEGIALKTALHGLAIFALSISFYWLYLKFVYPITEVGVP